MPKKLTGNRNSARSFSPRWWPRRLFIAAAFGLAAGVAASMVGLPASAKAEEVDLSGKTITLVVGFGAGGTYDLYARLAAEHLGKFLPGKPSVVVENMSGGGGMRSTAFLVTGAPKDGTVITLLPNTIVLRDAIGELPEGLKVGDLPVIGRLASPVQVIVTWSDSPVKTIEDATKTDITIGATSMTASSSILARSLNVGAGTKFDVVLGYKGTGEIMLAVERGEIGASTTTMETLSAGHAEWLEDGTINILVQSFLKRSPRYPDIPALGEFATDDTSLGLLGLAASPGEFGRVLSLPPGASETVVAAYRAAFEEMVQDADFLADAERRNLTLDPAGGAEVEQLAKDLLVISPEALEAFKEIMNPEG